MGKLLRAGSEAIVTIALTLGVIIGAFTPLFGYEDLLGLNRLSYLAWIGVILVSHLALAGNRRHVRLSLGVALGTMVMVGHLVMFVMGFINTDIGLIPVILHDFGFALVSLMTLSLVHLVIFRRRKVRLLPPVEDVEFTDAPTAPAVAPNAAPEAHGSDTTERAHQEA